MLPLPFSAGSRIDRRTLLAASTSALGLVSPSLNSSLMGSPASPGGSPTSLGSSPPRSKVAKSTIMIWLSGGASHIDTWDMKPLAPLEYRGTFQPVSTSAPDIQLCEHLPFLARQAHHLAIVRSLGDHGRGTGDHHAGYYYNLTGHAPDNTFHRLLNARTPYPTDWPSMASVVAMKRPPHPSLPQVVTLPQKEGAPEYTRPGQFAARIGLEYDPVFVDGSREKAMEFTAPALKLQGEISANRLRTRRELLTTLDVGRQNLEANLACGHYSKQQHKAFTLLGSSETKSAFDLSLESDATLERYGRGINSTTMLMARRLVEASVPFITVFWKGDMELDALCKSGGGWDTHGNNFHCLKDRLLPEFDRPFAALLADLHERGLLEETLVLVSSEMGRKPKIGDPRSGGPNGAGRDHWTSSMSVLMAGGGIRGGQVYGSSDRFAEYPAANPTAPEDIAHTLFHAMGINDLTARDAEGRPLHLMPEGRPLLELF